MQSELWSLSGLAVELGRDRRSLARDLEGLEPETVEHKGNRTERRWRMKAVVEHLYRRPETHDTEELDLDQERARLAKWQADRAEQDVEQRARRLLDADAVVQWVVGMIAIVKSRLLQIPDAVGHQLDPKLASVVAAEVRRLVLEALEELSARGGPDPGLPDVEAIPAAADSDGESVGGSVPPPVERKQRRARAVAD